MRIVYAAPETRHQRSRHKRRLRDGLPTAIKACVDADHANEGMVSHSR
ncbi:hypothetical protein [Dyella sp. S184]|nr:hypothetical protein [Dyella sp. S184]